MNASTFTGCAKDEPVSPEKLGSIDALRGLAAIYVVICHVGFIPHLDLTLATLGARFVEAGHTGVILFFLISSFTLCLSSASVTPRKIIKPSFIYEDCSEFCHYFTFQYY